MPLVSVIIPSFNCEAVLEPCLSAIRNSTFKDYEIIVVDGQSVDRTQEIARRYANKLLVPPVNRERDDARNQGIQAAAGKILVFTDADNVMRSDTPGANRRLPGPASGGRDGKWAHFSGASQPGFLQPI
jgi:glycosyltransferase involved in cell wall biosynthesis